MPAGEMIKPRLSFSALLYRPAKVGQFLRSEESMFLPTLSWAAAAFGVGRAVISIDVLAVPVDVTLPGRIEQGPLHV